jgi:predicted Zn-dependent protease
MLSVLSMLWVSAGIFRPYGAWQGIEAAIDSYEHGKFQNAAAMFAGLSGRDPKDDGLRLWLGRTYFKLHHWDDAIREFEQAV